MRRSALRFLVATLPVVAPAFSSPTRAAPARPPFPQLNARVIDTYECEWRRAINDPVTLKRFRHFVNSDRADDNIVFTPERGQIRPATREERELRSTEVG